MSGTNDGREFEEWLRCRLKEAADEIEPRDVLPEIWEKIRRHDMAEYVVTITELEDSPDDWPIKSISVTVEADDEDKAEEMADSLISLIQADKHVKRAMAIDEVYEA